MRLLLAIVSILLSSFQPGKEKSIVLVIPPTAHARLQYGAEKLAGVLNAAGYRTSIRKIDVFPERDAIIITNVGNALYQKVSEKLQTNKPAGKEGFAISSSQNNIFIAGTDETGTLYGCLELADRIIKTKSIPENISTSDSPQMVLRGTCIGLQKTNYLPGRGD